MDKFSERRLKYLTSKCLHLGEEKDQTISAINCLRANMSEILRDNNIKRHDDTDGNLWYLTDFGIKFVSVGSRMKQNRQWKPKLGDLIDGKMQLTEYYP